MSLSAVLLAGGESRRMGRDKATMEWLGRPLWEWQLEKLGALRPDKIFLSVRSEVPWCPNNLELILDDPPSRGPLSGLAATLGAIETDYLLVLAVDMPLMTAEHLQRVCGLVENGVGIVPMIDGAAEPLASIYPKDAHGIFREALQGEDFSLQRVAAKLIELKKLRAMTVSNLDRNLYRNINEPSDLGGRS